jgi:aerobic carbon-monoxide dehydrogenase large subunit
MAFIGQSTRRVEDQRFLTGRGVFVDDMNDAGQAWAYVVRSPHAHATIDSIDTVSARSSAGVLGIYTYEDIADLGLLPCATRVRHRRTDDRAATPRTGAGKSAFRR